MTESELESGQTIPETEDVPSPAVPSTQADDKQPSAAPEVDVTALLEKFDSLEQSIPDLIERGIQSTKDKRFKPLEALGEEGVEGLKRFNSYLKKYGGDEDEAIKQMRLDQMLESGPSKAEVVGATDAAVEGRMTRFARRLLATAGIANNDPRYDEFVAGHQFVSENRFYDALEDWIDTTTTKEARQKAAGAASVSQPAGTQAGLSSDAEELAAELERLQNPSPNEPGLTHPDNIARRKELVAKLKTVTPQRPDIRG